MKLLMVSALALALAGCGIVRDNQVAAMTPDEVRTLRDGELCRSGTASPNVMAERQRRGLADCSEAHLECRAMGYTMGTELYLACRAMVAQRQAADHAAYMRALGQVSQSLNPPPSITCRSRPDLMGGYRTTCD